LPGTPVYKNRDREKVQARQTATSSATYFVSQLMEVSALTFDDQSVDGQEGDNFTIKPLYRLADLENNLYTDTMPGTAPFLRGGQATMYTGRPWTIRQYAGFATASESNHFFRSLLATGAQGISVAFDLPTQRGYDSDHPRAVGDVGKVGVAVDSVEDMKQLFAEIPLADVSVSMTMNGAVLPILAAFVVAAEEQGVSPDQLSGTIQNDILKEFLVRNTYIYPLQESMRIAGDVLEYASKHMPRFNPISVSGYHMQEAGASPVLELALTLASGKAYVKAALARGLKVDDFAGRLSFFWGVGMDFYVEVAKLRAARLLWWRIMQAFDPKDDKSSKLRAHCQTSGWSLSQQDPHNNIVRTTIEAMAAVFGGTQSLHTNAFDEAIALPSPTSARVARNTQLILQEETDLCSVVDPWGGSYFMETLTKQVADAAWKVLEDINEIGGMESAVESGWAKRKIEESASAKQAMIDSGKAVIVGVSKYRLAQEEEYEGLSIDTSKIRADQLKRLSEIKDKRDNRAVQEALTALTKCCQNHEGNLLELSITAMRLRATVGEVSFALEQSFGRHRAEVNVVSGVYAANYGDQMRWEDIKLKVARFSEAYGRPPRILIAKLGQDGHDRGAKIVASSFADLGFDIDIGSLFQTAEECARQAIENDVHAIGVSTLSGAHTQLVPAMFEELKRQGGTDIGVFVGGVVPRHDHAALYALGVLGVFGPGTPIPDAAALVLEGITQALEAKAAWAH
jgi:methylmalonyl-CoA mutase